LGDRLLARRSETIKRVRGAFRCISTRGHDRLGKEMMGVLNAGQWHERNDKCAWKNCFDLVLAELVLAVKL
jgi:hypothetical protein